MTVATQKPADSPSSPGNSKHPEPASREFDPTPYLRQIRGRGGQTSEYLDVRHRVLWLRTVHPDAQILTELLQIDDGSAVFRASVTIPGGGSATGHGSESRSDFVDFVEKAETKALGRALNALGFGVQFAETEGEETRNTVVRSMERERDLRPAGKTANRTPGQNWTLFWEWARGVGFSSKDEVERALGKTMDGLTPAELQAILSPLVQGLGATG